MKDAPHFSFRAPAISLFCVAHHVNQHIANSSASCCTVRLAHTTCTRKSDWLNSSAPCGGLEAWVVVRLLEAFPYGFTIFNMQFFFASTGISDLHVADKLVFPEKSTAYYVKIKRRIKLHACSVCFWSNTSTASEESVILNIWNRSTSLLDIYYYARDSPKLKISIAGFNRYDF